MRDRNRTLRKYSDVDLEVKVQAYKNNVIWQGVDLKEL